MEVYFNKTWGTVCDDYWDLRDAAVVCRQLGYPEAAKAEQFARFGPGEGTTVEPLIMDTLKSGQPPYNGHTVHPLPIYCPYISISKEGTTSEQWT